MIHLHRKSPAHAVFWVNWPAAALALLLALCSPQRAQEISAGPLVSRFRLTLDAGAREEVLGPVFYDEVSPEREVTAMPPLWSWSRDTGADSTEFDILYPVFTYDRFGAEYRIQLGQMLSFAGGRVSQTETNFGRFTLFPFYFQERSPVPERNSTAVWPFYGRLQNRLFRDEIDFVLWPAYVKTKRHAKSAPAAGESEFVAPVYRFFEGRRGDITTYNFLAPIFHVRTGAGLKGWQVWPLVGAEHAQTITWTNHWGDPMVEGGQEKFFLFWPLFIKEATGLGTTNEERQTLVLPFAAVTRSPLRDSTSVPWPIGLTYTVDRARHYREWCAPWPVIVFARGEGKTTSRVWPLFGQAHNAELESEFYLWPLYKYEAIHSPPLDRRRSRIAYFLYSDTTEKNTESGQARRRVDAWPLFSFQRDWAGSERWQTFAILEPFLPTSKSVERNYSPLWSVVRAERNAVTGAHSESLFWNCYRHESTVTNRHSSLLFGLVQWQAGPEGRTSRWFYLPSKVAY
jgi:hypothetical protein